VPLVCTQPLLSAAELLSLQKPYPGPGNHASKSAKWLSPYLCVFDVKWLLLAAVSVEIGTIHLSSHGLSKSEVPSPSEISMSARSEARAWGVGHGPHLGTQRTWAALQSADFWYWLYRKPVGMLRNPTSVSTSLRILWAFKCATQWRISFALVWESSYKA